MDTVCGHGAGPKIWNNSRTSLRGRPKNGQNFGWGKNSRCWASSSAKKVLLTAEKVGSAHLTKKSGGVKHRYLEEGGPKMAKIQYGVKPDIFEYAHPRDRGSLLSTHLSQGIVIEHVTISDQSHSPASFCLRSFRRCTD